MDIFHVDVITGVRMQVLSEMEIQDISGGRAFCSDSMSSSEYTATAGFWGGVGTVGAGVATVPGGQALGGGILIGAGVMYAYNSYCSA
ncbi:hypothetical protein [Janthinobacterium sp. 13]|uniref:hypothetical protein n=1 Tax=Janthinobacterium sp. 13 TaxID=2035211 RepID=UPI00117A9CFC|nr:hypothetical protein [Janthinobacterium sp. 13]